MLYFFKTRICKMTILVTYLTLEGDLFVVELLYVRPFINFELDGFWKAFAQINLDTNTGTRLHVVSWLASINVFADRISNGTH